jgi:Cellulase (glycosyl hydrolase family 5)
MMSMRIYLPWLAVMSALSAKPAADGALERVRASDDRRGFVLEPSGRPFSVRGFNYDHDERGRLIEDYWEAEWPKVEEDFQEMKDLGATVVRVHLQYGKFFDQRDRPNPRALEQLGRLLTLAERLGLYLDLTGLGCYHKKDVPAWYDELSEPERWAAQARFWEVIAERCAASPAVFCYDLMNEPVVPGGKRSPRDWLGPAFAGKHFVQMVSLDQAGRPRPEIAGRWIHSQTAAIRKHDRTRLVTVGLVDWSLDRPGLTSGFAPREVVSELDFIAVHLYPETGKLDEAVKTLKGFSVGKPIVIEETFPLKCSRPEFARFFDESRPTVNGWIGFYWGKTRAECRRSGTIPDAMMDDWLGFFEQSIAGKPAAPR